MRNLLLISLVIILYSCGSKEETQQGPIKTQTGSKDMEFIAMQDSILRSYNQAMRLINQIDSEISKIDNSPMRAEGQSYEQSVIQKIEYLKFQLSTRNEEIAKLEKNVKSINGKNKALTDKIKTLESIINEKNNLIIAQNQRISELEQKLGVAIQERDIALQGKKSAEEQVTSTVSALNTAFYILGTEKQLEKDGIISMQGEGFLGIGGKWVPNEDADLRFFTKIDIYKDTEIILPGNNKLGEIASTHSKKSLKVETGTSGTSILKILNPDSFWKTDKKLIIIIEEN